MPAFKRKKKKPSELENAEIVEGDIYYFYDADENLKLITDVFIEEEVHVVARSSEFQAAIICSPLLNCVHISLTVFN